MAWFQRKEAEERTSVIPSKLQSSQPHREGAAAAAVVTSTTPPPALVRLPRSSIQKSSISFTVEDTGDQQASKNLWQVYALGGFMVGRWMWVRWKERRDARSADDDDNYGD
eukprot:c22150_g1_i1 orf=665-997(-)